MATKNIKVDYTESYQIIGEFVSKVNSIEISINTIIEKIVLEYSKNLENETDAHEVIDFIQQQSLKTRINHIIIFLSMTKGENQRIKDIIKRLKTLSKFYNKNLRDTRDFVAHNVPLYTTDYRIVSSRRSPRDKKAHIKISELKETIKLVIPQVIEAFKISSEISRFFTVTMIERDL